MTDNKKLWCGKNDPKNKKEFVLLKEINPILWERIQNPPQTKRELFTLAYKLMDFAEYNNYNIYQPESSDAFQNILGAVAFLQRIDKDGKLIDVYTSEIYYKKQNGWI